MQARYVLVPGPNQAVLETETLDHDRPKSNEALLETEASFISAGTELAIYTGVDPQAHIPGRWCTYPFRSGYANVSRIAALGEDVKGFEVGDRVFTFTKHRSHQFFDGFGKLMIAKVPDGITSATAAAARMAGVAISAVQVADVALNDWVVVFGLGAVGNLAAQFFQLAGARVIGVDPAPARRQLAQRMGIERVADSGAEELEGLVKSLTRGAGARITVDAVGQSQILTQAARLTARYGEVVALGTPRAPFEANLTEFTSIVHYNSLRFLSAFEWRIPQLPANGVRHSSQENVETILDLVARGKLHVDPLISHRLPAEEIKTAYEGLLRKKDEYFGVVLTWK